MSATTVDVEFPVCCQYCPHRDPDAGSCEHEARQTLVHDLTSSMTCPAYVEARSDAMRNLARLLS